MNLTIDRIILHSFKGAKQKNLLFNNSNVIVSGANGTGKSTVMCAWFWLMADCNESLVSNPAVFPLNTEEANPSVEVVATIDGKKVTLERQLKRTVKKSKVEGVSDAVSFSSTYLVNSVDSGLRDFKKKLEEYGITDKFLTLSHPEMFLSQKKDEMRKILFFFLQAKTDYEIACMEDNTADVAKLLKDYTYQEVEGMQKSTLRKIAEAYGKSGEIINSKIDGLEMSKTDIDFAELELQKNAIIEQIAKIQSEQVVYDRIESEIADLRGKNMQLQFEISGLRSKAQEERQAEENRLLASRREVEEKAKSIDRDIKRMQNEVEIYEHAFQTKENEKKLLEKKISEAKALVMDETKTYCPVCNRKYAESKIATIRANFEADKKIKIDVLEEQLKENASLLAIKRTERAELDRKLEKAINDRAELETVLQQPVDALQSNMPEPDVYGEQIAKLESQLETLIRLMDEKKATKPNLTALKAEELRLKDKLKACEIQLSKSSDNARIDDMIAELREQQKEYEQNKADAEKIQYELSLVQKRKYNLLTESINANFKLVKWCFWEYQKNGEPKDVIIPKVDGKALGSDLNTAMCIMAKLDIVQGLQNYYGENYPVFVDGAEALDETSMSQIDMSCQMVYLKVAENKDLFVKEI